MSKKREDLEAIADLLYEWAVEWEEPYVAATVLAREDGGISRVANIGTDRPDYRDMDIYKTYRKEKEPGDGNREGSGTQKNN